MKFITLTDKLSGAKFDVNGEQVKLIETLVDGSTHIVFGADMGRQVVEAKSDIYAALGVAQPTIISLPPTPATAQLKK
jgi:hypothetical protein